MNLVDQKIVFYFESNLKIDLVIKKCVVCLFFKNGSRVDLVDHRGIHNAHHRGIHSAHHSSRDAQQGSGLVLLDPSLDFILVCLLQKA